MTQPNIPFHLHATDLSPDAPATSADLPAEVAGQPASYFWKDMIHSGNYVHPNRGFSLAVDGDRLGRWADTGRQMLAAGVAIPINCDHSDAARDVVGYVKEFKLDGQRLLGLCQFIGDDAALTAARNLVSVGIDPDFTDGQARNWGEAIVHLALTPVPVVPGQDQFVEASSDGGSPDLVLVPAEDDDDEADEVTELPCTQDQFEIICDLLGDEIDPEESISRILERLQAAEAGASDDDDSEDVQAELSAARQRIVELSARVPQAMSAEAEAAMVESATMKFDLAVERGNLSPHARDRLVATLVKGEDGRPNLIALSRGASPGGDRALAMAVAEILLDNPPIDLGEKTRLQAMSRHVPGDDSSPIEQLRQYMTRIASVSG
jgi:hypothetical protein